jgi:hypothetical protein
MATAILAATAHTLYAAIAAAYLSSFAALAMYAPANCQSPPL